MKKLFKNTAFSTRDYKATNLVYALGESCPIEGNWEETNELEWADNDIEWATDMKHLFTQAGVKIYGYL